MRELTREEKAAIRSLVTKWCANYDREMGCLRGILPRKRFLFARLWDKLSQGAERLPRVPLPAALHIVSRNPTTKTIWRYIQ